MPSNNPQLNYKKILEHSDRSEIINKLTSGLSVRDVTEWLRQKYPNTKSKQIGFTTLDEFRRGYLNLSGSLLVDLKAKIKEQQLEEINTQAKELVKTNKTYNEKLEELVDDQIDWRRKLNQLLNIIETRFGQLFDITQSNPNNYKPDRLMIEWMRTMITMIAEIRKVEGAPDQIIQHNVTIETIDNQISIIQKAILQTFEDLPLDQTSMLIDKFNRNIQNLKMQSAEGSYIYNDAVKQKIEIMSGKLLNSDNGDNDENDE